MPPGRESPRLRTLLSWSSGKDSAWALKTLRAQPDVEVVGLLTTFNQEADRVAMHAVRRELVGQQARAAGLPLIEVELPWPCPNEEYEAVLAAALEHAKSSQGVSHVAFGDLYLEDIRAYRERQLSELELKPLFPIWGMPTAALSREMVRAGLKAYLTCVDPRQMPSDFVGRSYNDLLLDDLPEGVDPCGESGEFHTFVFDGPMFDSAIPVMTGELVERDGFVFADVLPA